MTRSLPLTIGLNGARIVELLDAWFTRHGRTFPWRRNSADVDDAVRRGEPVNDPYVVLVSEVMLQQTQTARIATALPEFLERFPTVGALAAASTGDVLRAWQGLGYNSRAMRLHRTARDIVEHHRGVFPSTVEELRRLEGIGPYTAAAIACFAFGAQVPVVDVNIQRVLSRLFYKCHTVDARQGIDPVTHVDEAVMPAGGAYWWHQALMDLGATICTARRPACERCPLEECCLSAHPRRIALFGTSPASEPTIAGSPRRIWRGRIVEQLRGEQEGVMTGELLDRLHRAAALTEHDRVLLVAVVDRLVREGLVVVESAMVAEHRSLTETTVIRLPA